MISTDVFLFEILLPSSSGSGGISLLTEVKTGSFVKSSFGDSVVSSKESLSYESSFW